MKKLLLSILLSSPFMINAQDCADLFFSGYVEGYANNRAVEIYNPTDEAVNLSDYSVGRFSNGSTGFIGVQLQDAMLAPGDVYVVVLDKRDPEGAGYEEPVWNGYVLIGEILDEVTGEPLLDADGNPIIGPLYDAEGGTLYGDVYNADYDLEGLADEFVCPVYNINNALYHNGNDAVAIIKGTEVDQATGGNILDVVGVIGVDPGEAWVDADGSWITKDKTLKRKATVMSGTGIVLDEFDYTQWDIYPKNTFNVIGSHVSDCQTSASIGDLAAETLTVSPNPAVNNAVIANDTPIEKITVMNIAGQIVEEVFVGSETTYTLNVEDFESGVYVVSTVLTNGISVSKKLMVQ